ncbi:MAG: hypothetical protein AB1505_31400 [Candidatus Latescibacterota bacterium]
MKKLAGLALVVPALAAAMPVAALGQTPAADTLSGYVRVPFNLSLFPPLAVAGGGQRALTSVGWHLVVGRSARLEGAELGVVGSIQSDSARGLQVAGLFNRVGGPLRGGQVSGFANSAAGPVHGLQTAGLLNHTRQALTGAQAAGLVNYADGQAWGGQLAGLLNYAGGTLSGVQASGFANLTPADVTGIQMTGLLNVADAALLQAAGLANHAGGSVLGGQASGLVNVAEEAEVQVSGGVNVARTAAMVQVSGLVNYAPAATAQVGFVNVARHAQGAQVGFVNWAAHQTGVPVGAFSYVAGVPVRLCAWGDETGFANTAVVSGTPTFYSLLGAGVRGEDDHPRWWTVTTGFGAHLVRGATFCEVDGLSQMLAQGDDFASGTNQITRLRVAVGRQLAARAAAFVGVSLGLFTSEETGGGDLLPWTLADGWVGEDDGVYVALWPGVYAGMRF